MIKELENTNLIAVKVASDATGYGFGSLFTTTLYWYDKCGGRNEYLRKGDYKILGEVTKDKIGFNVSDLPELPINDFYRLLAANGLTDFEKLLIIEKK